MDFVVTINGRTYIIFAPNESEAQRRAAQRAGVGAGSVEIVRQGGQAGDAQLERLQPTTRLNVFEQAAQGADATLDTPPVTSTPIEPRNFAGNFPGDMVPVFPAQGLGGQLEQQTPFGTFSNFLGAYGLGGDDPRSAARTFAESQFNPMFAAFGGQQIAQGIDPAAEGIGNEFSNFLRSGGWNPRQRLGESFRQLQGAAGNPNLDPESFLAKALNAQTVGESKAIFDLAEQLQQSRISPLIGRYFQSDSPETSFARFAAQRARGSSQNALDFARERYGLGGLGF